MERGEPLRTRRKGALVPGDRQAQFAPGGGLAAACMVLLALWIPFTLAHAAAWVWLRSVYARALAGHEVTKTEVGNGQLLVGVFALLFVPALLVTGALFVAWYRRVYRNLMWFGESSPGDSPAWACWSWVVPVACWFVPVRRRPQ